MQRRRPSRSSSRQLHRVRSSSTLDCCHTSNVHDDCLDYVLADDMSVARARAAGLAVLVAIEPYSRLRALRHVCYVVDVNVMTARLCEESRRNSIKAHVQLVARLRSRQRCQVKSKFSSHCSLVSFSAKRVLTEQSIRLFIRSRQAKSRTSYKAAGLQRLPPLFSVDRIGNSRA
jgi:hypothetical protein